MSEREDLEAIVARRGGHVKSTARDILAAGYRKRRTITTAEELDALPIGSVVLDPVGISLHRDIVGWNASNGSRHIDHEEIERDAFPATILHEGTQP